MTPLKGISNFRIKLKFQQCINNRLILKFTEDLGDGYWQQRP
jgi:hypothetical protein